MGRERERKFLLKNVPDLTLCEKLYIEQGYLSTEPEVRLRRIEKEDERVELIMSVKSDGDAERGEYERHLTVDTFNELANGIVGLILKKDRYLVPLYDGLVAEVDIYQNLNLVVVEVEFKTTEDMDSFIVPEWFGEEVTYDKRFKNKSLSKINLTD